MSRQYNCKKCKSTHEPPTGKKCTRDSTADLQIPVQETVDHAISQQLRAMTQRLDRLEVTSSSSRETPLPDSDPVEGNASTARTNFGSRATASSLRSDQQLQREVQHRLSELQIDDDSDDEHTDHANVKRKYDHKPKKSGRVRTADDVILHEVDWPHYYVYRGLTRRPARFEELSIAEFVFGYLTSLLEGRSDANTCLLMLEHLTELMKDAIDIPWERIRNFHGIVLHHQEMARLSWENTTEIRRLRDRYVRSMHALHHSSQTITYCPAFQKRECPHTGGHDTPRGLVRHICAFCHNQRKGDYNHPEIDCKRKMKSHVAEKNEPGP